MSKLVANIANQKGNLALYKRDMMYDFQSGNYHNTAIIKSTTKYENNSEDKRQQAELLKKQIRELTCHISVQRSFYAVK